MQISRFLKYGLIILIFSVLHACKPDTVYYTYNAINANGWSRNDTLQFNLPDTLSPGTYHLEVGIRHSGKYVYRDLWLELTQYMPSLDKNNHWEAKKDTIHLYLANEKGNWNGTGTTGGHFQLLAPSGNITIPMDYKQTASSENLLSTTANASSTQERKQKNKYTYEGKQHGLNKMARFQLKVTHIMTDTLLMHISDVGLQLTGPYSSPLVTTGRVNTQENE